MTTHRQGGACAASTARSATSGCAPTATTQYVRLTGRLAHYLDDPYTPVVEREPVTDHVTVAFIGGGFAGLVTGARLKEAGVDDVRIVEKGGDVGGTWYWNRYPGAQCDTASLVYLPLLEETGHMPSEKYAHGPEILEHCRRIAKHYGLYDDALFHTEVQRPDVGRRRSAAGSCAPTAATRSPRSSSPWAPARCTCRSCRASPASSRSPGTASTPAAGTTPTPAATRTARRWTGSPTSASPIIGTGATAVQCVPHLARACARAATSSSARRRRSTSATTAPLDPEWFASIAHARAGSSAGWRTSPTTRPAATPTRTWCMDGWTDLARRIRARIMALPPEDFTAETRCARRSRTPTTRRWRRSARASTPWCATRRPPTALKAWYRQLCKRPCFHDEYLQAFNAPNVHLVDTDGQGVERITETGCRGRTARRTRSTASSTPPASRSAPTTRSRAGYDLTGRDGVRLSEHWADGMRSKHGIHVHGFPNAFLVQPTQGANLISNIPHNLTEAGRTIATVDPARPRPRARAGRGDARGRGRLGRPAAHPPRAR